MLIVRTRNVPVIRVRRMTDPGRRWSGWIDYPQAPERAIVYRDGIYMVIATRDPEIVARLSDQPGITQHPDLRGSDRPERYFVCTGLPEEFLLGHYGLEIVGY